MELSRYHMVTTALFESLTLHLFCTYDKRFDDDRRVSLYVFSTSRIKRCTHCIFRTMLFEHCIYAHVVKTLRNWKNCGLFANRHYK